MHGDFERGDDGGIPTLIRFGCKSVGEPEPLVWWVGDIFDIAERGYTH
jgi:hypothetical protein